MCCPFIVLRLKLIFVSWKDKDKANFITIEMMAKLSNRLRVSFSVCEVWTGRSAVCTLTEASWAVPPVLSSRLS